MSSNKGFSEDELNHAKAWDLPFVENPKSQQDIEKTNALNFRADWKYEPPEEEEEILPPTAQEIEDIRQAARDEGYAEGKAEGFAKGEVEGKEQGLIEGRELGHAEGLAQGLEEGKVHSETQAEVWLQLISNMHDPLAQANDETRDQLVKLAVTLAKSVIKTEVTTNPQVILQALNEGMRALPINQNKYHIQMNPEDIALVTEELGETLIAEKGWQFIEAPTLQRGGCDIATEHNAVDVSIERRCRDVIDKFLINQGLAHD